MYPSREKKDHVQHKEAKSFSLGVLLLAPSFRITLPVPLDSVT